MISEKKYVLIRLMNEREAVYIQFSDSQKQI